MVVEEADLLVVEELKVAEILSSAFFSIMAPLPALSALNFQHSHQHLEAALGAAAVLLAWPAADCWN